MAWISSKNMAWYRPLAPHLTLRGLLDLVFPGHHVVNFLNQRSSFRSPSWDSLTERWWAINYPGYMKRWVAFEKPHRRPLERESGNHENIIYIPMEPDNLHVFSTKGSDWNIIRHTSLWMRISNRTSAIYTLHFTSTRLLTTKLLTTFTVHWWEGEELHRLRTLIIQLVGENREALSRYF